MTAWQICRISLFYQRRVSTRIPAGLDSCLPAKKGYRVAGELMNTETTMERAFWIDVYPGMTEEKIDYMVRMVKSSKMGNLYD